MILILPLIFAAIAQAGSECKNLDNSTEHGRQRIAYCASADAYHIAGKNQRTLMYVWIAVANSCGEGCGGMPWAIQQCKHFKETVDQLQAEAAKNTGKTIRRKAKDIGFLLKTGAYSTKPNSFELLGSLKACEVAGKAAKNAYKSYKARKKYKKWERENRKWAAKYVTKANSGAGEVDISSNDSTIEPGTSTNNIQVTFRGSQAAKPPKKEKECGTAKGGTALLNCAAAISGDFKRFLKANPEFKKDFGKLRERDLVRFNTAKDENPASLLAEGVIPPDANPESPKKRSELAKKIDKALKDIEKLDPNTYRSGRLGGNPTSSKEVSFTGILRKKKKKKRFTKPRKIIKEIDFTRDYDSIFSDRSINIFERVSRRYQMKASQDSRKDPSKKPKSVVSITPRSNFLIMDRPPVTR